MFLATKCNKFKKTKPYQVSFPVTAAAAAKVTSVVSNSVRPHRRQPTRLLCPWDSPGKSTGVGFLQCMKVKSEREVAQSCPTLHDPMDCSLPGSSVHGIFQARVLEWVAIAFSFPVTMVVILKYTQRILLSLTRPVFRRNYLTEILSKLNNLENENTQLRPGPLSQTGKKNTQPQSLHVA